jgi:hypothetical protein
MREGLLSPVYRAGEDLTQAERIRFFDPHFVRISARLLIGELSPDPWINELLLALKSLPQSYVKLRTCGRQINSVKGRSDP